MSSPPKSPVETEVSRIRALMEARQFDPERDLNPT